MNVVTYACVSVVCTCECVVSLGQANFICSNQGLGAGALVLDWTGSPLSGPDWRAELYGGAMANSLTPVVDYGDGSRGIAAFTHPGIFFTADGLLCVLSVPPAGWAWLQVKVWDVQMGATYEQALAHAQGGFGQSTLFYAQGGNPGGDFPTVPAPLTGLTSFSVLLPVPEPATWALLAVGLGGLAWCRRW